MLRYSLVVAGALILAAPAHARPQEAPDRSASLYGHVLDEATGAPVEGAEVHVGERSVLTSVSGFFAFEELAPGAAVVSVSHLAYEDREVAVQLVAARSVQVEIRVSVEALALDPIEVTVRPSRRLRQMQGFEYRREVAFGRFFTRDQLELLHPRNLGDVLREVPGIHVRNTRSSGLGDVLLRFRGGTCQPKVWVDGVERNKAWSQLELKELPGWELEAVEVYKALETPAEFYDPAGSPCVTIVAWTRPAGR